MQRFLNAERFASKSTAHTKRSAFSRVAELGLLSIFFLREFRQEKKSPSIEFNYEISFPSFPSSSVMKVFALISSVAPYVIFLDPVLAAQSLRFEYSSIEPPPTMKTIASEKPCLLCPKLAPVPGPGTPGSPPGATEPPAWPRSDDG